MTNEIYNPTNKLRDQREYSIISDDPNSKCDGIRFIIRTLSQMSDETLSTAT